MVAQVVAGCCSVHGRGAAAGARCWRVGWRMRSVLTASVPVGSRPPSTSDHNCQKHPTHGFGANASAAESGRAPRTTDGTLISACSERRVRGVC